MYDSRPDTQEHIRQVRSCIMAVTRELASRAMKHDRSKLEDPELSLFDEYTPKLSNTTYGSDEYKGYLKEMGKALDHHYEVNDHHPEHFGNGVQDMNLIQIIEMLCDWKAATLRHKDGDLRSSIEKNASRFGYDENFAAMLTRTAAYLGWL